MKLQRLSSNESDFSNHSKHKTLTSLPGHSPPTRRRSITGSDDTAATASHTEEDVLSQESKRKEEDDDVRLLGVPRIELTVQSSSSRNVVLVPEAESKQQEDDDSTSDSLEEGPSVSLLDGLASAVPQAPEEAAGFEVAPSTSNEEEKTEEGPDVLGSSSQGNGNNSSVLSRTAHSRDSPPVSPDAGSIKSSSSDKSNPDDQPQQSSSPQSLLRRSKNGSSPPRILLNHQDSSVSWDMMEGEDVLTDMMPHAPHTNNIVGSCSSPKDSLSKKLFLNSKRSVEFSHVHTRNYNVCIGDNPCCGYGPPLSLDWDYIDDEQDIPLDIYEQQHQLPRQIRRSRRSLVLTYTERRARLWRAGYTLEEIDQAAEALERQKWRQSLLGNLEPLYRLQEAWVLHVKPMISQRSRKRRALDQQLEYAEQRVRDEHSQSGEFSFVSQEMEADLEGQQNESKTVLIEGMASLVEQEKHPSPSIKSSPTEYHSSQEQSNNSHGNKDYGIRVDKKQNDKATEIILCSMRRPHMRAFHAAWFSFFVAFFSWFAIAPLLSEVKESLQLDKADIWMSSLFGTAGTIVFRLLMGPACDKWGARVCMSVCLALAAIPTALTGLVQTSAGLSVVRLFIGIAGSSFVACEYWTSDMFSRETAGTANALVAGWGNFGGGVANLVMGSALFPLFQWFYRDADDDDNDDTTSAELAWRTIFVVPAALCIVTAVLILFYCDDSPTGFYRDRIKNESLVVANPIKSFQNASKNWNVWILAFQYACCFGVEVTMTNASALYFKDEFGQSTVSAAGIASIFGFMNLFARGLGGFWSDKFQNMYGVKGRLFWQVLTLILEGLGVGLFAFAESLATSIIALVFLSIMVQSAEGSTFGIVPYVSRRYTGSVVGIVGSGGSAGAAMFSVFFVYFSYNTGFIMMGVCAIGSAFLSFFMNTQKLAHTYEAVALEVEGRKQAEEEEAQRKDTVAAPEVKPDDLEKRLNDEIEHGQITHVALNEV